MKSRTMVPRLRFGVFLGPFHPPEESPLLAVERDLELTVLLDQLGFEEAWIGEHHTGGWELIGSPELFVAAASQRTSRLKFGTGVSSLPYHQPFMLADRIVQLDYLTRGRIMFGTGPGSLPSDAYTMGIPTPRVRDRMEEALDPLVRLLRGETVSMTTDWFTLQEARLQLLPHNPRGIEVAVASQVSPTGAVAAGKLGLSLLSIGATSAGGFNALASNWAIAEETAAEHGQVMDRSGWRLVGPMHLAETREQALEEVQFGFHKWADYFQNVAALPLAPDSKDALRDIIDSQFAVVGTPDDAVAQIRRLQEQSGGFGCFMLLGHNWATWANTRRSYEMFARYVIPAVHQINANRYASEHYLRHNQPRFRGEMNAAVGAKLAQYAAKKGTALLPPNSQNIFGSEVNRK